MKGRDGKTYTLRATGSVVQFDGFLKVYEEGRDDRVRTSTRARTIMPRRTTSRRLPALAEGDRVTDRDDRGRAALHRSRRRAIPKRRWSRSMEELGIGRPSTYASTLAVLQERDYVRIDKKRLIPEDKGRLVTAFLESFFKRYVEYDFTADLEEKLDLISDGKLEWKDVLRDFWRDFIARGRRDQGPARRRGAGGAQRAARAAHLPAQGRGRRPARSARPAATGRLSLKIAASSAPSSAARTIPNAATRASSPTPDGDAEASTPDGKLLGNDPETGLAGDAAHRPLRPLRAARRRHEGEKPKRS